MNAFIDSNGVLICLSEDAENGPSLAIAVAEDTVMEAGKWRRDGSVWVEYIVPIFSQS